MRIDSFALDDEQRAAATAPLDRHILVCSGPGGGKTRTLTARYVYLLDKDVRPDQIMAVTFTNKAAREMKERIAAATGMPEKQLCAATFHSHCARLLRRFAAAAGLRPNYSIFDDTDSADVIVRLTNGADIFSGFEDSPSVLCRAIGHWKAGLVSPETALVLASMDPQAEAASLGIRSDPVLVARLYAAYQEALRQANALDFDDLLVYAVRLLQEDARVAWALGYAYVLVDEYQDVNQTQYSLLQALASTGAFLYLVGDPDQSIYMFRRALTTVTDMYVADYSPLVYHLTTNYRSAPAIIDVANTLIQNNESSHRRPMRPFADKQGWVMLRRVPRPDDEPDAVARLVADLLRSYQPRDIAVLSRVSRVLTLLEEALWKYRVPYTVHGHTSLFEYQLVRAFLAYWRLLANPSDRVALRLFLLHQPGIGSATADHLLANLPEVADFGDLLRQLVSLAPSTSCRDALVNSPVMFLLLADPAALPGAVYAAFMNAKAHKALDSLQRTSAARVAAFLQDLTAAIALRLAEGEALVDVVGSLRLLAEPAEPGNVVTLSTIHGVKGLEFSVVVLASAVEGILPLSPSLSPLDEERRLCYVAATRAKERLYIFCTAQSGPKAVHPSRFLREMMLEEVS